MNITVEAISEHLDEVPFEDIITQEEAQRWRMLAEALSSVEPVLPKARAYLKYTGRAN